MKTEDRLNKNFERALLYNTISLETSEKPEKIFHLFFVLVYRIPSIYRPSISSMYVYRQFDYSLVNSRKKKKLKKRLNGGESFSQFQWFTIAKIEI